MVDLVGTCPKGFWREWIAEGDAAGEPESGESWAWWTRSPLALKARPGDRFYVVAYGKLRGYAPIIRVISRPAGYGIIRQGGAVACTIPAAVPGFQGLRARWWPRDSEIPFPEWREP